MRLGIEADQHVVDRSRSARRSCGVHPLMTGIAGSRIHELSQQRIEQEQLFRNNAPQYCDRYWRIFST